MKERGNRFTRSIKHHVDADLDRAQSEGTVSAPVGTTENPSSQIFTIANVITFCRLLLTIAFLVMFTTNQHRDLALILYMIAAITDFLDGYVARATQTVSWLGKAMDPVLDVVLLFSGVFGLLVIGELPVWIAVYVVLRDLSLFGGSIWLSKFKDKPMDVIFIGKLGTALLMTGFCDLLLHWFPRVPGWGLVDVSWLPGINSVSAPGGILCVYVGMIFSGITCYIYWRDGLRIRRRVLNERKLQALRDAEGEDA